MVSCYPESEQSSGGAGLHNASGTTTYISYTWRYSYPELHNAASGSIENWPLKARLCKEIKVTYQYDKNKGQFAEISHETVVDEQDVYQNDIIHFCY
jgi:hypothetical protein